MKAPSRSMFGGIAAAVLATLTLYVFYRLQDYGPESAILRFNDIIRNIPDYSFHGEVRLRGPALATATQRFYKAIGNDAAMDLQRVSIGVIPSPEVRRPSDDVVRWLMYLKDCFDAGATVQIGSMDRTPDEVRAVAIFKFPPTNPGSSETVSGMVWVVVRKGKSWYVDANKTAIILADAQGRFH